MTDGAAFILSLLLGAAGGIIFFGGLYLTTQALLGSRRPGMLMFLSFMGRVAVAVAGAWWAARFGAFAGVGGYLVGLTAVRFITIRQVRRADAANT